MRQRLRLKRRRKRRFGAWGLRGRVGGKMAPRAAFPKPGIAPPWVRRAGTLSSAGGFFARGTLDFSPITTEGAEDTESYDGVGWVFGLRF